MIINEMTYPGGTRVLVWRLEEEAPRLLALCREAGIAVDDLEDLPVKRQREKEAERLLLCRVVGHPVILEHTDQGAPYVRDLDVNISITHTPRLVALAIDDCKVIGLDAEQADRGQVLRVRDKFLNANEQQFLAPDDLTGHVIAWTAKEAIIKAERDSVIDWTDGIRLEPFAPDGAGTVLHGTCRGHRYRLCCRPVARHFITVAMPEKA